MDVNLLILGLSFFVGMILSAVFHVLFQKNDFLEENYLSSSYAIAISSLLSIIPLVLIFWNNNDFVGTITPLQFIAPLLPLTLIAISLCSISKFSIIIVALLSSFLGVYLSDITIEFSPILPSWINMYITAITLWLFTIGFYSISGITPLPQAQGIIPAIGFILLALIGAAPFILGLSSAAILGVLLISYFRCGFQPLELYSTLIIGYIIGWLGLMSYPEYLLPCFAVFCMYYFSEYFISIFRKISTLPKYKFIPYNTSLCIVFDETNSVQLVSRIIWHTGILLIILGIFQINSSTAYSFPLFALMLCAWQQYRILNWQTPEKSFKQNSQDLVNSVKSTFSTLLKKPQNNQHSDDK